MNEGELRPTGEQIATRAGMSVRSVFRHLADREALDTAILELHIARTAHLFDPPPDDGDRATRITALARHRRTLYETISPVRRASRVHAPFAHVLRARIRQADGMLRGHLPRLFPDLDADDLEVVAMVTSWSAWEAMRHEQELGPERAEHLLILALGRIIPDGP